MGFNTTTEAIGIRLSSFGEGTSKFKLEQMEGGGKRQEILVTRVRSQFTSEFESFDQEYLRLGKHWLGDFLAFSYLCLSKIHIK